MKKLGRLLTDIQAIIIIGSIRLILASVLIFAAVNAKAQSSSSTAQFLSSKLGLYVFPANDQTKEQQEKDEYDCYKWAVEQSGVDPLNLPQIEAEKVETGPDGGAVRGAAGGAAAGAAIGAIAGDAGKGAAIGATAGGIRGLRGSAARQHNAQNQAEADAKDKEQELMDNFIRAFTVSLEGKGYKVSK